VYLGDGTGHEGADRGRVVRSRNEIGEEPGRDAVLERVADHAGAGELVAAVHAEAAVIARRVEVAPVEVRSVAGEVAPVAGRRAPPELVHVHAETLQRAHFEAVEHPGSGIRRPHAATLTRPAERVPDDARDAKRPCPQPQSRQVDPAEPPHEDRVRLCVRERHG
jgi:hypothetical protein